MTVFHMQSSAQKGDRTERQRIREYMQIENTRNRRVCNPICLLQDEHKSLKGKICQIKILIFPTNSVDVTHRLVLTREVLHTASC